MIRPLTVETVRFEIMFASLEGRGLLRTDHPP